MSKPHYRRATLWLRGQDEEGFAPGCHVGPDFDRLYCKLCGEFTEAFAAQVLSVDLVGLRARLHHWPLQDGLRIRVEGASQRFCNAHVSRNRKQNDYATLQQLRRRQAPGRDALLRALSIKYPELRQPQGFERAKALATSQSVARMYGRRRSEAIEATTPARLSLLENLCVPAGVVTRPESLLAVDINRDRIALRSSQGEDWSGPAAPGAPWLQAGAALAAQVTTGNRTDAPADRLLLDLPDLWAHARLRPGAVSFDFASVDLWPELEEVVAATSARQLPLHAVQAAYQVLRA